MLSSDKCMMPKISKFLLLTFCFACCSLSLNANSTFVQREDVQSFIKEMVTKHHFDSKDLQDTLKKVVLQPQIIQSMEQPYEKKSWDVYRNIFLTSSRLEGGLKYWMANKNTLAQTEQRYGVPAEIIVAILGVETLYGERQGENRVLDALATLAFDYPKRSAYFKHELKEYLLLCREHHADPTSYKGSYAGAMGQPQFMPSSYRNFAIDFNHKGIRDLISNNDDSIASIANYFREHGWQTNDKIAQAAKLRGAQYKSLILNPRTANYSFHQLASYGIKPDRFSFKHPKRAALMEFSTTNGNEYWLAYPNFFVITRYNSSPQYAMVVYLLAQQLKAEWDAQKTTKI